MTDLAEESKATRFVPGQPDMWAFVLFETLVFTGYFAFYLFARGRNAELFLHSQAHLDLRVGVFNTLVLLLSSWSVARCVQSARAGAYRAALRDVFITAGFAVVFLFSGVDRNDFFMYYFFLTGIHFVHLLIGFVVLGVIVYQLMSPARRSQEIVETGATYWHTVDFLWVLIFALLYVVR
jgi:nitric oxide reductase NorE protein